MSEQDNRNDGGLVPTGRREVAPVAAVNLLVSRGIADLAKAHLLKPSEGIRSVVEQGLKCLSLGLVDEAIWFLDVAILLSPNYDFAVLLRGIAWFRKEDYDKAIQDFDHVIRLGQEFYVSAYGRRDLAWYKKEDYDQVIEDFDNQIWLYPDHTSAYALRAVAWFRKGNHDRAIQDFDEAIRLLSTAEGDDSVWETDDNARGRGRSVRTGPGPGAELYYRRGIAWINKGDYDYAIKDFDETIRLDPEYPDAYERRGSAWYGKEDYDKAIQDFDHVIRVGQEFYVGAYARRGLARYKKGDYDQAIKDFDEAIRLMPDARFYALRGVAWIDKNDYDKAIRDFDEAILLDPIFKSTYERLTLALEHSTRLLDCKQAFLEEARALLEWERQCPDRKQQKPSAPHPNDLLPETPKEKSLERLKRLYVEQYRLEREIGLLRQLEEELQREAREQGYNPE